MLPSNVQKFRVATGGLSHLMPPGARLNVWQTVTELVSNVRYNRPLHVALLVTAILTFPLVWLGGLVTSHGAGMSVPDWPNSYGYNMFALPFSQWLPGAAGGTFFEHSHRLLGTLVGLGAFTATMLAWGPSQSTFWRRTWGWTSIAFALVFVVTLVVAKTMRSTIGEESYKLWTHVFSLAGSLAVATGILWTARSRDVSAARRWLVTALLAAVIVQGLMGGLRVERISLVLAKLHGIFGQMTFALAAVVATMCSRWWLGTGTHPTELGRGLKRWTAVALALIVVQLALGALMRHDPHREANASRGDGSAGLAIPDWPLHYGKILPPTDAAALAEINEHRRWDRNWPAVSMWQVWLHFSHRLGAYVTTLVVIGTVVQAWRRHSGDGKLIWPAMTLGVLIIAQVTLGVFTVLTRKAADIATLHQATGALVLVAASILMARAVRLYPARVALPRPTAVEITAADGVVPSTLRSN